MLTRPSNRHERPDVPPRDAGFSLTEMVVAAAIIIIVASAFTFLMLNVISTQRSATLSRIADRTLGSQMEAVAGTQWQDLMLRPSGAYSVCDLGGGVVSTQTIIAGPEKVTSAEGVEMAVIRNVVWLPGGVQDWADRSNTPPTSAVPTQVSASGTTATVFFASNPGFAVGDKITVANITNQAGFNGYYTVTAVNGGNNSVTYTGATATLAQTAVTGTNPIVSRANTFTAYPTFDAPTGAWAGNAYKIATWNSAAGGAAGAWSYATDVSCSGTKNSPLAKSVTVTVLYNDGRVQRSSTATVVRSKWTDPTTVP